MFLRTKLESAAVLLFAGLCVSSAGSLSAHPMAPSLLELRENQGRVQVLWKVSLLNPQAAELQPMLPPSCRTVAAGWDNYPAAEREKTGLIRRWTAECGAEGMVGQRIGVDGLDRTDTSVLLRVALADGRTARAVLRPEESSFVVPRSPTSLAVAGSYLRLGFEHILGGFDHLLFVLGLLFLIQGRRMLLLTVTAFTVGHSLTLSLAALDLVRLPSAPVELAIAASIWVVALELARKDGGRSSWAGRRPWLVAGVFGLLHGFGFAGALAEAGLPAGDIPLALLSFNAGIELGQLAFIALVLILKWGPTRLLATRTEPVWLDGRLGLAASYVIGILATYWCLQRGSDVLMYL